MVDPMILPQIANFVIKIQARSHKLPHTVTYNTKRHQLNSNTSEYVKVNNVNVGSGSGGNDGRRGQQGKPQAKHDYRKGSQEEEILYTLEMKREMLEMIKSDAHTCEVTHGFNCPESTIHSLKKNKEALTASVNVFLRFSIAGRSPILHNETYCLLSRNITVTKLSDSDQALPANQEEEMVDDLTPSTSPPLNCEVLSVCEFGKKYNIKNAVDRIVEVEDLQEIVGQHQQQPTIEEMLEEDEEQEEQQPTQEDDVKPGEPTTHQLTELLTNIARLGEQLQEYDSRPHPRNLICPVLNKLALITVQSQPINALANITLGDDDDTTDDDRVVLGDLLVEELPQDFDAEVRGGSSNQPSPSTRPVKHFTDSIKVSYSTV
ncbi:hypothetical protein Hamer_G009490 [Homarus americanus]|uniref:Uncharacterized protein n=1 Tax=Homarus americanus TaxID=6706 RepID=A0A8J5MJS0_HOMAM|nr:hypothetical protein Hamer_G009490 [Homarus americanus]